MLPWSAARDVSRVRRAFRRWARSPSGGAAPIPAAPSRRCPGSAPAPGAFCPAADRGGSARQAVPPPSPGRGEVFHPLFPAPGHVLFRERGSAGPRPFSGRGAAPALPRGLRGSRRGPAPRPAVRPGRKGRRPSPNFGEGRRRQECVALAVCVGKFSAPACRGSRPPR